MSYFTSQAFLEALCLSNFVPIVTLVMRIIQYKIFDRYLSKTLEIPLSLINFHKFQGKVWNVGKFQKHSTTKNSCYSIADT